MYFFGSNSRNLEAAKLEAAKLEAAKFDKAKEWFLIYFQNLMILPHSYADPKVFTIGVGGPEDGFSLTELGKNVIIYNRAINNETNTSYRSALIDAYNRLYSLYTLEYINAFESQIDKYNEIFEAERASYATYFQEFYPNRLRDGEVEPLVLIAKYREEKKDNPDNSVLSYLIKHIKLYLNMIDMNPKLNVYNGTDKTSDVLKAAGKKRFDDQKRIAKELTDAMQNESEIYVVMIEANLEREGENDYPIHMPYIAPIIKSEREHNAYNEYLNADNNLTRNIIMMAACKSFLKYKVNIVVRIGRGIVKPIASDDTIKDIHSGIQLAKKALDDAEMDYKNKWIALEQHNKKLRKAVIPKSSIFTFARKNTNSWTAMRAESEHYYSYFKDQSDEKKITLVHINNFEDAKFEYVKCLKIWAMLSTNSTKVIKDYEEDKEAERRRDQIFHAYPEGSPDPREQDLRFLRRPPSSGPSSGGNKQKTKKQKKNIKRRPTKKQYSKIKKGRRTFHNIRHSNHNTRHRKNKKYMTGGELTREAIEEIKNQVTGKQMRISKMNDNINRAHEIWKRSSTNDDDMLENDICQYVKNKYHEAVSNWELAKQKLVAAGDDSQMGEEAPAAPAAGGKNKIY